MVGFEQRSQKVAAIEKVIRKLYNTFFWFYLWYYFSVDLDNRRVPLVCMMGILIKIQNK